MFTLDDLAQHVAAYQHGEIMLDDFEDWFRTNSRGAYRCSDRLVSEAVASVEAAFSKYYFQGLPEQALLDELTKIAIPVVSGKRR